METLNKIPTDSGCYIFKDKSNEIIYIGKAKNLKKRVKNYFSKKHEDEKTNKLVKDIKNIDYFITSNEVEALILENNLIKKHKPKYNINLKESKKYAYLLLTNEEYPRLITVRDKKKQGIYFGPFTSGEYREQLRKLLVNNFGIRTCNKMPKKACLKYHINLCPAPCEKKISQEEYLKNTEIVKKFLKGKTKKLIKKLEQEMKEYSQDLMFENAKIRRDQIRALNYLNIKQKMEVEKNYDENIINYVIKEEKVYLIVFNINKGILTTKNEYSFFKTQNFLEEFIKQYYFQNSIPKEIILPKKLKDEKIKKYLEKLRKQEIRITIPIKGIKKELMELVKRNIEATFLKQDIMISELRKELNLNFTPTIIEAFDVSHLSGTGVVGSSVRFLNAKPDKKNYRKYKMKTYQSNDDFKGIYEIVHRRYKSLKETNQDYPDLIVIDGGLGQLNAGLKALKDLELKIPTISLAKKNEEIYLPKISKPLKLKKTSKGLNLLIQARNEAHRFAINYQKSLRSKR